MGIEINTQQTERNIMNGSSMKKLILAVACSASFLAQAGTVVGYINIPLQANTFTLIADPLFATPDNTLQNVLPIPQQDGTAFQKYYPGVGYSAYLYDELTPGWLPDGAVTLNPGEGAFIKSPVATTITFVGVVPQGTFSLTMPKGAFAIVSAMVPISGTPTQLNFPAEDGDLIQTYDGSTGFSAFVYDALTPGWLPYEPTFAVGQAFFVKKSALATSLTWTQTFFVTAASPAPINFTTK
jgi:hypothetical protein